MYTEKIATMLNLKQSNLHFTYIYAVSIFVQGIYQLCTAKKFNYINYCIYFMLSIGSSIMYYKVFQI